MKLSSETLNILKSFSGINQSIVLEEGNQIRTISTQRTVMAKATVEDEFPVKAGIYNLARFLSAVEMYKGEAELEFESQSVTVTDGKSKTKYVYADPSMIITPPDKEIKLPSSDVSVSLSAENLSKVLKAANVLQLPEVAFVGEEGTCYLKAMNSDNPSADSFGVELGETEDTFTLIIKTENLPVMPMDYEIELSSKGISQFKGNNVTYFIAVDSKSKYEKGK